MYIYLLTSVASKKNLAFDHRPELLNYLRQGLPDCNICVYQKTTKPELDEANVMFKIIQARLHTLQFLCRVIEETRARSVLRPPFLAGRVEMQPTLHWKIFAQAYDIDLGLLTKEQSLIEDYCDDVTVKSIIFFHHFCRKIVYARSIKEINDIRDRIQQQDLLSKLNS